MPATAINHVADRDFNDQRYFVDASSLAALGWVEVGLVFACILVL